MAIQHKCCQVNHYLPGRMRITVPGLKKNRRLLDLVVSDLGRLAAVKEVRGSIASGRILVFFAALSGPPSEERLSRTADEILRKLHVLLGIGEDAQAAVRKGCRGPAGRYPAGGGVRGVLEPEDLPPGRQVFNVVLGGAVLAAVGIKHLRRGPSGLARSPALFNLAALTALVSGYPVLKSGAQHLLARGRLNFDFILGTLGLGTALLRESIPGLLVFWLVNLNSLLQSLVLAHSRALVRRECPACTPLNGRCRIPPAPSPGRGGGLRAAEEDAGGGLGACARSERMDPAVLYGDRMLPVALGFSAFVGLAGRDWRRSLAMMLAASPGPAGLAGRTARAAGMAAASRREMAIINPRVLPLLPDVDVLVFSAGWKLCRQMKVEYFYALPGFERLAVQNAAADLFNAAGHPLSPAEEGGFPPLHGAAVVQLDEVAADGISGMVGGWSLAVGTEAYLRMRGADCTEGRLEARRAAVLGATPLFVAVERRLAAVIGVVHRVEPETVRLLEGLRARGVRRLVFYPGAHGYLYHSLVRELGLECWSGIGADRAGEEILLLRRQGRVVAVAAGEEKDLPLLAAADIALTGPQFPGGIKEAADVVLPAEKLPALFALGLAVAERERQNIRLTAGLNALGLLLGAVGYLSPVGAAVYNNAISVLVALHSYGLLTTAPRRRSLRSPGAGMKAALPPRRGGKNVPAVSVPEVPVKGGGRLNNTDWSRLGLAELAERLGTDPDTGLSSDEAALRLSRYGENRLESVPAPGLLARFAGQMKDFLVRALLCSSIVCLFAGEVVDALAIMSILVLNAVLGAVQEQRAEGAMALLKEMSVPVSRVLRGGCWRQISSFELVPGDVIMLEAGDGVPADARLVEANELQVMEAALTGESCPVDKDIIVSADSMFLPDCKNMIFMGTVVTRGRCRAVVVATGMHTELGAIAGMLSGTEYEKTPLQKNLIDVGKTVLKASLLVSGLVIVAGVWRGEAVLQMLLTGISLAVAAIPEGLPAIVTVALAGGVRRMARVNAVVRRLPAVENLGSTTVICTDKTGTLTKNEQTVRWIFCADGGRWRISPAHAGGGEAVWAAAGKGKRENLIFLLTAASLCSNARLLRNMPAGRGCGVDGDPLEGALLIAAERAGLDLEALQDGFTRVREVPFDSERYRMTVVCRNRDGECFSFVKGAPDVVFKLSRFYQGVEGPLPVDELARHRFLKAVEQMTAGALRVLAVAYRPLSAEDVPAEEELIFLGLIGMQDPPRPEVGPAISACRRAGIRVVMITGDHRNTALAVGRELGLAGDGDQVLTGAELEQMDDGQLQDVVGRVNIFARVLPRHKLRLVRALKRRGELVTMIGDGVNDAPAVREADIGVAMGRGGTEVTRQSAQLVLADDNFTTVVNAVEQGRSICANVRRAVRYLLATNAGEVLLMFFSTAAGLPLPLLPIQLLWLNFLGDGLPAIALSLDPPDPAVMDSPPRNFKVGLFDRGYVSRIVSRGLAIGIMSLAAYWLGLRRGDLGRARTLALAAITAGQLAHALDCRHDGSDRMRRGNPFLVGSVALSGGLLLSTIYLPPARRIFKTFPLTPRDWGTVAAGTIAAGVMDGLLRSVFSGPSAEPAGKREKERVPGFTANQEENSWHNNKGGE